MQQLCGDLLDRVASTIPPAQAAVAFANSVDKCVLVRFRSVQPHTHTYAYLPMVGRDKSAIH